MRALARTTEDDYYTRAANDDCIKGGPGTRTKYVYDANGNRLSAEGSTYTISSTSNRLMSVSGAVNRSYSYDAAGHTTGYSGMTFGYSDSGRLKTVSGSASATYQYNALGERVKKVANGTTTYFVYDEAGHLIGEYDGSGNLVQETVWMNDIPVATLRPNGSAIDVYYVHTDHLNTPRRITRPSDNVIIWRWDSDPFGTTAANEDPDGDQNDFVYHLRFPGQYLDEETGLHYNYFRDYDPVIGRYVESDPIGLAGGLNTYAYVAANPLSFVDPLGLQIPRDTVDAFCLRYPAECASVVAGAAGAYTVGQQLASSASGASSISTPADPNDCDDDDKKCEEYKADARRIYNHLAANKIPEYMRSLRIGEGDFGHYMAIVQRLSALRIAVAGVRRHCKTPPPELERWERLAYQEFLERH
jgi:RHS repeat-associated protein